MGIRGKRISRSEAIKIVKNIADTAEKQRQEMYEKEASLNRSDDEERLNNLEEKVSKVESVLEDIKSFLKQRMDYYDL